MTRKIIKLALLILSISFLLLAADGKLAQYFRKLESGSVLCTLCPNYCKLTEGETGLCRVRKNIDGNLYSMNYGKAVSINIDPVEKKPLFHFCPGENILSIAAAGCNLRCSFCQNWEISQAGADELPCYELSPSQVINLTEKYGCKLIAYTYSEPIVFYEYMYDIAMLARQKGIKNVLVTGGYINEEPLRGLCKYLDAVNIDLKGFTQDFYSQFCSGRLQAVKDAISILKEEGVFFEITNLVIPGANDDKKQQREMCEWIARDIGKDYPLHFSRFFPKYRLINTPMTPLDTLFELKKLAQECGINYVYIGNIPEDDSEDTYCPQCGKKLIDRKGYEIKANQIKNGKCPYCGKEIFGIWE